MVSSFVSFASVSTSSVGIMGSSTHYKSSFGSGEGMNAGIVITMFLIMLLIFFKLSEPLMDERIHVVLGGLRIRFSTRTSILFIIFMIYFPVFMPLSWEFVSIMSIRRSSVLKNWGLKSKDL